MNAFKTWCGSNSPLDKCTRTIFQGVIGVIMANIDLLVGYAAIPHEFRPMIVAMVMAILSPIQAAFGSEQEEEE